MKKISYFVGMAVIAASLSVSCGGSGAEKKVDGKSVVKKTVGDSASIASLDIRYIDEEKLLGEYNLAKDFKESMTRAQSKLISAQQSRANDIQQLGSQIETKMRNNGYTTESEYNADMARFQKKQQDAETYLANLQRTTELEIAQLQTQLQDSIKSYVKIFSEQNGYDAVLLQSAGFYFNPVLDVTDAVIKGLNARYNKVAE